MENLTEASRATILSIKATVIFILLTAAEKKSTSFKIVNVKKSQVKIPSQTILKIIAIQQQCSKERCNLIARRNHEKDL